MSHIQAVLLAICNLLHIPGHNCIFTTHNNVNMVPATAIIKRLDKAVLQAEKKSGMKVVFPKQIPKDPKVKNYYAYTSLTSVPLGINFIINIDSTKECKGVHYCNIGSLQSENKGNPQIYHDRYNKKITVPVMLAFKNIGYFTPGHAMGDYWPAMIQWRDNGTMYTISWNIDPKIEQIALIKMANSIIIQKKDLQSK